MEGTTVRQLLVAAGHGYDAVREHLSWVAPQLLKEFPSGCHALAAIAWPGDESLAAWRARSNRSSGRVGTGERRPLRHPARRQSPDRSPLRAEFEAALAIRARQTQRTSSLATAGTGSAGATSRNRNGPGRSGSPLGCASSRMRGRYGTNRSYVDGGQTSREPRDQCLSNDLCRDDVEYLSYGRRMN